MSGCDPSQLPRLADPFPEDDVEWRVSRTGAKSDDEVWCKVLAYISARAISSRLDDVCGVGNWQNTSMETFELRHGIIAIQVGISILINGVWVTKYDVADQTDFEPVKGGFSGAMKRAGAQWGIGRYLYDLDEEFADVVMRPTKGYKWEKVKDGKSFGWKPPKLPSWALPNSTDERPVTAKDVSALKSEFLKKMGAKAKASDRAAIADAFRSFCYSTVGVDEFPVDIPERWTRNVFSLVSQRLSMTSDVSDISPDIPT